MIDTTTSHPTLGLIRWNADYTKQAGVTTISLSLARAWKSQGCEIVWIGACPPAEDREYMTYVESGTTTSELAAAAIQAQQSQPIDMFITFEPFIEGYAAAQVKATTGVPFAHFGMHFSHDDSEQIRAEKTTYAAADFLVYQCEWFREHYITPKLGTAIANDKPFLVAPFGVDTQVFTPGQQRTPENDPIILFAGRLNRENCPMPHFDKGAEYLVQAAPKLIAAHPQIKIRMIGDGPQLPALRELAASNQSSNHIEFLGEVNDRNKLLEHLQSATIFTLPSMCDVFPVALVEAMSVGLPIVSTRVGGIPECVDSDSGILIKPGDANALAQALLTLLGNPEQLAKASRHARMVAEQSYDWNVVAMKALQAFRQLIAG